ncbi:hypothetical protein [Novosphingobium sp. 17-62-19]|uniref:hypothetical protein n=1 Tax=Novosphingobium sp. 17-62-19 TaxID=1970406 RepID=UPI0025DB33EE|nr:hypothetical protein [Novosphingobium sp. 17-62-19]HQS96157.1 hypothetical protein [Novosphingobium sp.]
MDKTVLLTTRVVYKGFEIALDFEVKPGLAGSRDLESDLADLIRVAGEAGQEHGNAFVLAIDELQYVPEEELAALISALHRANQAQLPITQVGAGLPQLLGQMGPAKSYAERPFAFVPLGPHRSDDLAEVLGMKENSVAPTRSSLIRKGMFYSPAHAVRTASCKSRWCSSSARLAHFVSLCKTRPCDNPTTPAARGIVG